MAKMPVTNNWVDALTKPYIPVKFLRPGRFYLLKKSVSYNSVPFLTAIYCGIRF